MEAGGSHVEGLNVGEAATPSDVDDHLTTRGATVLVLPAGILRTLINAEMVHASKQQLGKTRLLQALTVGLSLQPSVKNWVEFNFTIDQGRQGIL